MQKVLSALLVVWGVSSSAQAAPPTFGPILGRGAQPSSMLVRWGTATAIAGQVSYRKVGAQSWQTAATTGQNHLAELSNLELGTSYEYFVSSETDQSSTFHFSTCPPAGMPMTVVFYGDNRSDVTEHQKVVAQIAGKAPDTVFSTGDIVPGGQYSEYLTEFFPVVASLVASTPFLPAPGNHDDAGDLANNYGAVFARPTTGAGEWYSMICGNAMFVSLDSNRALDLTQIQFLKDALTAARNDSTIDHSFVFFHHAPFSTGDHGDAITVQLAWIATLEDPQNKVTAVFSGHDHTYERLTHGSSPVTYVVTGGAGANLYDQTSTSGGSSQIFHKAHNFVLLYIAGKQILARAYDDNGVQIDSFGMAAAPASPDLGMTGSGPTDPPDAGVPNDPNNGPNNGEKSSSDPSLAGNEVGGCSFSGRDAMPLSGLMVALFFASRLVRRRSSV